jgi:hypothetical protein
MTKDHIGAAADINLDDAETFKDLLERVDAATCAS